MLLRLRALHQGRDAILLAALNELQAALGVAGKG